MKPPVAGFQNHDALS